MFDLPIRQFSKHVHNGMGQWLEEAIATSGLLARIWGCRSHPASVTAFAVAAYIIGAYRFLDDHNAQAEPFQRVADPDEIIAAVRRGHQALDSIH